MFQGGVQEMSRFRQSIRLEQSVVEAIDSARGKDARHISRNDWIVEAILEKLKRVEGRSSKGRIK